MKIKLCCTYGQCSCLHSNQYACSHTGSGLYQISHRLLSSDRGSSNKDSLPTRKKSVFICEHIWLSKQTNLGNQTQAERTFYYATISSSSPPYGTVTVNNSSHLYHFGLFKGASCPFFMRAEAERDNEPPQRFLPIRLISVPECMNTRMSHYGKDI